MKLLRLRSALSFSCALLVGVAVSACGPPAQTRPPTQPGTAQPGTAATTAVKPDKPVDPFAIDAILVREQLPAAVIVPLKPLTLGRAAAALTKPPASCTAYQRRAPEAATCSDKPTSLAALDAALGETEPSRRDSKLAGVESCSGLPVGLVRALRAELAPVECGDVLVAAMVNAPPAGIDGAVYDALAGIALGARLRRAVGAPPAPAKPHSKDRLRKFIAGPMGKWAYAQGEALERLADQGATLRYYGRAIVALEAGMADLRFIDSARMVPAPDEYKGDKELENSYYGGLEMSLDPRKQRGRDATLVGLGQLAVIGVIRDPRVKRARRTLSRMYGGRPIDALDSLLLPPLAPQTPTTVEQRLAARLPTFYAGLLLAPDAATDPALLRQLIEKGVPLQHRLALAEATLSDDARALYARARLELAQAYWRTEDIDEMLGLLREFPAAARSERSKLLLAVGISLRGGPANAAAMMLKAPLSDLGMGDSRALDHMAASSGEYAALAAFNSALVARLSAPASARAEYWKKVAARFRKAEGMLADSFQRDEAGKRATEAEEIAASIAAGAAGRE